MLLSKQNLVNKCSFDELGLLQVIEVFSIKNNRYWRDKTLFGNAL